MKKLTTAQRIERIENLILILHKNEDAGEMGYVSFMNKKFVDSFYICNMYASLYTSWFNDDYPEIALLSQNETLGGAYLTCDTSDGVSESRRIKIVALLFLIELLKRSKK